MIIVFSGTGNSLHVANLLAENLNERVVKLPCTESLAVDENEGRIVWVFPVYSWGVPPIVMRWLANIVIDGAERVVHHLVLTCGDDIGLADKMWQKAILSRGWNFGKVFSVQMPNTYVFMKGFDVDSSEIATEKVKASKERCATISDSIMRGGDRTSDVVRGKMAWLKTKVIYPYFVKFEMSPKPFHASVSCIGCGLCSRVCPLSNIKMEPTEEGLNRPAWGSNCALCSGCYHCCPVHAVQYGKTTLNKGQKKILTR